MINWLSKSLTVFVGMVIALSMPSCVMHSGESVKDTSHAVQEVEVSDQKATMPEIVLNNQRLAVQWEENTSVSQLISRCSESPLRIELGTYGGFELVGALGYTLEQNDQTVDAQKGDIVLYQASSIVIMVGENRWTYTRLGVVENQDLEKLEQALASGGGDLEIRMDTST